MGKCYKDQRFDLGVQTVTSNQRYQNCLNSNNKIRMIGYRNKLEDCTKYLPPPTKPVEKVDVKCVSSKVKLLYAAFGIDHNQPVCKNEKPKAEVVYTFDFF